MGLTDRFPDFRHLMRESDNRRLSELPVEPTPPTAETKKRNEEAALSRVALDLAKATAKAVMDSKDFYLVSGLGVKHYRSRLHPDLQFTIDNEIGGSGSQYQIEFVFPTIDFLNNDEVWGKEYSRSRYTFRSTGNGLKAKHWERLRRHYLSKDMYKKLPNVKNEIGKQGKAPFLSPEEAKKATTGLSMDLDPIESAVWDKGETTDSRRVLDDLQRDATQLMGYLKPQG